MIIERQEYAADALKKGCCQEHVRTVECSVGTQVYLQDTFPEMELWNGRVCAFK